jgi:glutathione S-transferase
MNTAASPELRLYELVLENGCSASPFVWRTRFALAHKGLAFQSVPLGFTEIPEAFGGRFKTVPVIGYGEEMLSESWDIAANLDRRFPAQRQLFSGPAEFAMVKLFDAWLHGDILRRLFRIYALDIHNAARPQDRAYFRRSREQWMKGATLEEFTADRVGRLPEMRQVFDPLRTQLASYPFLGGAAPNYADYIALGVLQWIASVSTLPLLAADDEALRQWVQRGRDLYGGAGRDARMQPLFE